MYLVDTSEREHQACQLFVQTPPLSGRILESLGLLASFSWFMLRLRMDRLVQSMHGDVDILAGTLNWKDSGKFVTLAEREHSDHPDWHPSRHYELAARKLALQGGIQWPPSFGHLIGVEAKCSYLPRNIGEMTGNSLRSTKSQSRQIQKIRNEVDKLLELGFDHVVLLDIIANPPVSGAEGGAWISASALADRSTEALDTVLRQRLPEDSGAAHWVWSIGSVAGGDEFRRGAGAPFTLCASKGNSRLANSVATQTRRKDIEERLRSMLSTFDAPTAFPAIFLDCQRCGKIHPVPYNSTGCISA